MWHSVSIFDWKLAAKSCSSAFFRLKKAFVCPGLDVAPALSVTLERHGSHVQYLEYWDDCSPSSPENLELGKAECSCKGTLGLKERKDDRLKMYA